jgi:hypothetical protein
MAREVRRDDVSDPTRREGDPPPAEVADHQVGSKGPRSVRCRRDADGIEVWVPADQVEGFPGQVVER